MSHSRNADDFLLAYRRACANYDRIFSNQIREIRRCYSGVAPAEETIDEALEAHIRVYFVNALLAALNWRMDLTPESGLPNMIPESPVRSGDRGTRRFLDYLGYEQSDLSCPLMVVETKRPSSKLPDLLSAEPPASSIEEIILRGLQGETILGQWAKWLWDVRDYVRSVEQQVGKPPRRVVVTNGDWIVVFQDPSDAFLGDERRRQEKIVVFESAVDVVQRSAELYRLLEYSAVSSKSEAVELAELPFVVDGTTISWIMHGVRLVYSEVPGIHDPPSPVIKIVPVLFLGTRFGKWLMVKGREPDKFFPHKATQLKIHLTGIDAAAKQLLNETQKILGIQIQPKPIVEHYNDPCFELLPGVLEEGMDHFRIVTGKQTHYLRFSPSVEGCPWHKWSKAKAGACESGRAPIICRSVNPRAFFKSEEDQHCAHGDVHAAKASMISAMNRPSCGPRSGADGQAFCEIWRFETHLCCRTCTFESVCTSTEAFRLPCVIQDSHGIPKEPENGDHIDTVSQA